MAVSTLICRLAVPLLLAVWGYGVATRLAQLGARGPVRPGRDFERRLAEAREAAPEEVGQVVSGRSFLVIGGGGFTGSYLVSDLMHRGARSVRIMSRRGKPSSRSWTPLEDWLSDERLEFFKGSVGSAKDVVAAAAGVDTICHLAAYYGSPSFTRYGNWSLATATKVNVEGMQNILAAARASDTVTQIIYTSSTDVVFNRTLQLDKSEMDTSYYTDATAHYIITKSEAERQLLAFDGTIGAAGQRVTTTAIRPAGIYGPGEDFFVPKVVKPAAALGWMFFYFDASHRADMTFVYNIAHAHALAIATAHQNPPAVGGKAYFITDGEVVNLAGQQVFEPLFAAVNVTFKQLIRIPPAFLRFSSTWGEWICHTAGLPLMGLTEMEAWRATISSTHSIERARRDFGYKPLFSTTEGMRWTAAEFATRYG